MTPWSQNSCVAKNRTVYSRSTSQSANAASVWTYAPNTWGSLSG